jgi:uracil-DNA glycosylase
LYKIKSKNKKFITCIQRFFIRFVKIFFMKHPELIQLKNKITACKACSLHKIRTQTVFGEGNEKAGILLIGEGPGYNEDQQGRPFVGRSGKLLDTILNDYGLNRQEHVFIGNIVKCRPPENRKPRPEERETCMPYLLRQIELINPKIIILLGATALNGFIDPKAKITQARGTWINWNNRKVMPTFHPSALLRNPNLKKDVWNDFKMVAEEYKKLVGL